MKNLIHLLLIIIIAIAALFLVIAVYLLWASKQPAVKANYYTALSTDEELEKNMLTAAVMKLPVSNLPTAATASASIRSIILLHLNAAMDPGLLSSW